MRNDGNALLLTLLVCVTLLLIVGLQARVTRYNVALVDARAVETQTRSQALFTAPKWTRTALGTVRSGTSVLTGANLNSGTAPAALRSALTSLCVTSASAITDVSVAGQRCSGASDADSAGFSRQALGGGAERYGLPFTLRHTTLGPDGSRSTQLYRGSLNVLGRAGGLPVTALQLRASTQSGALPSGLLFDGPVMLGTPNLTAGVDFAGGLSSGTSSLTIGGTDIASSAFAPNPAYPCEQNQSVCALFGGGLSTGVTLPSVSAAGFSSAAGITLPAGVTEVVLFPRGTHTGFFACSATSCDAYALDVSSGSTVLSRFTGSFPVPASTGTLTDPIPAGTTPTNLGTVNPVIYAPGALTVRAVTPTGGAFGGPLTVAAAGTLTVGSSVQAALPVCSTYAVRDVGGDLRPATCENVNSDDVLGLVSVSGNVVLGDARAKAENDTGFVLHAAVLAPSGTLTVGDNRLTLLDFTGSAFVQSVTLPAFVRLAHDPRYPTPPGFPGLGVEVTAPTLTLEPGAALGE